MKFRATAVGVEEDGHPIQIFAQDLVSIRKQARVRANTHGVPMKIYSREEHLVEVVRPDKREKNA